MKASTRLWVSTLAVGAFVLLAQIRSADACGCFTPPDPSVPIVQAGESIIFQIDGGQVTAHIQIQYAGPAQEFGWLLPLPSQPTLELGTDELFAQLVQTTQPKYRMDRTYNGNCPFDPNNPGQNTSDSGGRSETDDPLVLQDSIGPYDYAVLRADSKQPMLDWLAQNRFFVPAGTDTAVDPYIRPGAYFLALKLQKGNDAGDIQPVVVRYPSSLPMIPIVLTSVAANPDMGVAAWVLGEARAIPRNYYHTVLNDAAIDWVNAGQNYGDVLTRAVDDAPGHHSFVTEYAGPSSIMRDVLDYPERFGNPRLLETLTNAVDYVNYLNYNGYPVLDPTFLNIPQYTSQMLAILQRHLTPPAALLAAEQIDANNYYYNIEYWLGYYRSVHPELFVDVDETFEPIAMTAEIEERVIAPTLAAGQLFRHNSYLTRLFTTMSPNEMTKDPVFSFNPDLPQVSNTHTARLIYNCGLLGASLDIGAMPAVLVTEQGWTLSMPRGTTQSAWASVDMPASLRTEILREEGSPEVVLNNADEISDSIHNGRAGGCVLVAGASRSLASAGLLLGFFGLLWVRRRARRQK